MQARLEEEELEKMRLGAALATLRADMESLSALHADADPGKVLYLASFLQNNIAVSCFVWSMLNPHR